METEMVRGYSIQQTARFIVGDEELKPRVPARTLQDLAVLANAKSEMWSPRVELIRLFEIIDKASLDEASSYKNLVRCGQNTAQQAVGTFLKLLLRILSPKQFVKKFPEIWSHDHKGGFVGAQLVNENTISIEINDVEGFLHIGPIATGFITTVLQAMGLKEPLVKDLTWSRAKPGPREIRLEARWR